MTHLLEGAAHLAWNLKLPSSFFQANPLFIVLEDRLLSPY